jgi:hypothetical protein
VPARLANATRFIRAFSRPCCAIAMDGLQR